VIYAELPMATSVSGRRVPTDEPTVARPSEPQEPFDYESIPAGYYDEVFRREQGVQSKWHHLKFLRVARELQGYHRVLDVGCGPGTLAGNFGAGHDWVGTDLSARQIAYARRTYGPTGARFYRETPAGVPVGEGPFDALTMVELIEHLDPVVVDQTLAEALERVRPGGKIVITTPNFRSAWPALEAAVNRFGDVSYGFQHINKFGPARLVEMLNGHGLVATRAEQYLFAGPFAAALGWRAADAVARLERPIERRLGLLLIGTAYKPD
jgi:2-polyprenyl-3-methyl-5-hydroxy-6-metoxy-1,4-benzoquinol methylase